MENVPWFDTGDEIVFEDGTVWPESLAVDPAVLSRQGMPSAQSGEETLYPDGVVLN